MFSSSVILHMRIGRQQSSRVFAGIFSTVDFYTFPNLLCLQIFLFVRYLREQAVKPECKLITLLTKPYIGLLFLVFFLYKVIHFNTGPSGLEARMKYTNTTTDYSY